MEIRDLLAIQRTHISKQLLPLLPMKVSIPFKGTLSEKFQKVLIKHGCRWYSSPADKFREDLWGYFYIDIYGFITCGNFDADFISDKGKEFSVLCLFDKLSEELYV